MGDDAGSIGKHLVPVLEAFVGGHEDRALFIAAVDDLIEQVGGVAVVGKVANLVTKC